jgi:hypothetical protein
MSLITRAAPTRRIAAFRRAQQGSTLPVFAIVSIALLGAIGLAGDAVVLYGARNSIQRAADAGALSAARELTLSNRSTDAVLAAARAYASAQLTRANVAGADVSANMAENGAAVRVDISRAYVPILGRVLSSEPVVVRATALARVTGSTNLCAIGLSGNEGGTIRLRSNSRLTAQNCAIYSNSTASDGLRIENAAAVTTSLACSAGGANVAGTAVVTPKATIDCPAMADPLAGRPEPAVGGCLHTGLVIQAGSTTLSPGTYCSGLRIAKTAKVTLLPGEYVFKDGLLQVSDTAELRGQNVGLFFKSTNGTASALQFSKSSVIELTAPKSGTMAGLLIVESASNPTTTFQITSDFARILLGTIYLPNSELRLDGSQPVSDRAAYTVVIARRIRLEAGPNLHLNTDYGATDIPVPKGVGPVGRVVKLAN